MGPRTLSISSLGIDDNYRKQLIEEVYRLVGPLDYKTNIQGRMTSYFLFNESNIFNNILESINQHIGRISWIKDPTENELERFVLCNFWGAVYGKGNYTKKHDHNNALFSFVYYLKTDNCNTPLVFDELNYSYTPIQDEIIFFPGDLIHHVPPHNFDNDRIVLAGNFFNMMDKSIFTSNQPDDNDIKSKHVYHEYS